MESPASTSSGLIGLHQIPNLLCILRVVFSFGGLAQLARIHEAEGRWSIPCLVVIGLAALTDRLDGFLAKRYGWSTKLGAVLDQISDKLVSLALYCVIGLWGAFPIWGVALIVFREMFVTCLRISANLERIAIPTSQAGRFKTFTQQGAVLLIFMHWAWPEPIATGFTLSQTLLWGGWALFVVILLLMGKKGFAGIARTYTVVREHPTDGTQTTSRADLVLVVLSLLAMVIPLTYGGPLTVLLITLGTGATYWSAYGWARKVRGISGGPGLRNNIISLLGSALVSASVVVVLERWPTFEAMWTLVGVLSVVWAVLLSISYRTGQAAARPVVEAEGPAG